MSFFDGRGVAYSYESTVPAPLLPSIDQSYNPPRSYKAPPMADARSVRVSTHWLFEEITSSDKNYLMSTFKYLQLLFLRIFCARYSFFANLKKLKTGGFEPPKGGSNTFHGVGMNLM